MSQKKTAIILVALGAAIIGFAVAYIFGGTGNYESAHGGGAAAFAAAGAAVAAAASRRRRQNKQDKGADNG